MPVIAIDYFQKEDYIIGNIPVKPLPFGMRNMAGFLLLFRIFCHIFGLGTWICRKARILPLKFETTHTVMRKISAVDTRFAGMMGVPERKEIGMCWEVEK